MKKCNKCGQLLPKSEFNKNRAKPDGFQRSCRQCQRQHQRDWYANGGKSLIVRHTKQHKIARRSWYQELKSVMKCAKCGENHSATLDLHHRDPKEKDMAVAKLVGGWGKSRILKEIQKCDVLCANCHRKLHYEMRQ